MGITAHSSFVKRKKQKKKKYILLTIWHVDRSECSFFSFFFFARSVSYNNKYSCTIEYSAYACLLYIYIIIIVCRILYNANSYKSNQNAHYPYTLTLYLCMYLLYVYRFFLILALRKLYIGTIVHKDIKKHASGLSRYI